MSTTLTTQIARGAGLSLLIIASAATAGWAGWNPDGVTISPTTAYIPLVSACSDGDDGTFVAWQEWTSPPSGVLHVQHVLTTGDLDPAWPPLGANACDVAATRGTIGLLPDGLGGVYLWWLEDRALFATRLDASGQVASGWPQRGRSLGTTSQVSPIPNVIEDGAHGFYAVWSELTGPWPDAGAIQAIHLGAQNTGAGGWPNQVRPAIPGDVVETLEYWPRIALAPDGGVIMTWVSWSWDTLSVSSALRLKRLTASGSTAPGWPTDGMQLAPYDAEFLWDHAGSPKASLLALSPDARGGVFLLTGQPLPQGEYSTVQTRLFRLLMDGSKAPGWPVEGRLDPSTPLWYVATLPTDGGLEVMPEGADGAFVGEPVFYDHATNYGISQCPLSGFWSSFSAVEGNLPGHEEILKGDGGLFMADFVPSGPNQPYQPPAFLRVSQSLALPGWTDWLEWHPETYTQWYGDIALAPSGDGGAVFFWSQVRDRVGLFARRFWAGGQVTAVRDAPTTIHMSGLRFTLGVGVRAYVTVPANRSARLELYDLGGRRIAAQPLDQIGSREVTLPGTSGLPSGVFFARFVSGHESLNGRVIVIR